MSLVQIPLTVTSPATGAAISGATVTVTIHGAGAAVIYSNATGTSQLAGNTYTTDSGGRAIVGGNPLYLIQGTYDFQVSGGSLTAFTVVRDLLSAASSDEVAMAGEIKMWGGSAAPAGYLLCDGSSQLRATYPALFAVVGTTFGSADGTHFNLPNLQDRFPLGAGTHALAATGGSLGHVHGMSSHTHGMSSHTHGMSSHTHTAGPLNVPNLALFAAANAHNHPLSDNGGTQSRLFNIDGSHWEWNRGDLGPTFVIQSVQQYISTNGSGTSGGAIAGQALTGVTDNQSAGVTGVAVGAPTDSQPTGAPSTPNTAGPSTANTAGPSTANTAGADPPYQAVNYIIRHGKLL